MTDRRYRVVATIVLNAQSFQYTITVLTLHEAKAVLQAWILSSRLNDDMDDNYTVLEVYNTDTDKWEEWRDKKGYNYLTTDQVTFDEPISPLIIKSSFSDNALVVQPGGKFMLDIWGAHELLCEYKTDGTICNYTIIKRKLEEKFDNPQDFIDSLHRSPLILTTVGDEELPEDNDDWDYRVTPGWGKFE